MNNDDWDIEYDDLMESLGMIYDEYDGWIDEGHD